MSSTDKKVAKKPETDRNYVDLRFKSPKHAGSISFSVYAGSNGEDIFYKKDANGQYKKITITPPKRRFFMNNPDQKAMWDFIKNHPFVTKEDSPFEVIDATESAKKNVENRRTIRKLELLVDDLAKDPVALEDFSRLVGINPDEVGPEVIVDRLYVLIDTDTDKMNKLLEDPDRKVRQLFFKGLAKQLFSFEEGVYRYGSTSMQATTEDQAIAWLNLNSKVLEAIEDLLSEKVG